MDIFRIIGVGLLTCIVAVIIKSIKPEFYIIVVLSGALIILFMLVDSLSNIVNYFLIVNVVIFYQILFINLSIKI